MMIQDHTVKENIGDWLSPEILERVEVKYLDTTCIELGTGTVETKHYPITVTGVNSYNDIVLTIKETKGLFKAHLNEVVADFLKENESGTLYFSPANKFSTSNKPAEIFYVFVYGEDLGGLGVEIQFESNFIIL